MSRFLLSSLALTFASLLIVACGEKDLRSRVIDKAPGQTWIYADWPGAVVRATKEKKPLFVSFRCVP